MHARDNNNCTDATTTLVAMMRHRTLKKLSYQGWCGRDSGPRVSRYKTSLHKCEAEPVIAALRDNTSLEMLHLKELSFRHNNLKAIPFLFLQAFEKNTTLRDFKAYGQRRSFTLPRPNERYYINDYGCAQKLQYSLWLNEFSRKQLHDKDTTKTEFVSLILKAKKARRSFEKRLSNFCSNVATEQKELAIPEDSLSNIFCNLYCGLNRHPQRKRCVTKLPHLGPFSGVETWCDAPFDRHNVETTSILYGLLRESPALWCSPPSALNGKRKRRGITTTFRPKRQATTYTNLGNIS